MQIDDAAAILAGADFFEICTEEERRLLAFASERKRFADGSVLVTGDDIPAGAHVLISGHVSVARDGEAKPYMLSQPGSMISTMALLTERPRGVTVRAVGAVETLFVPRNSFLKLLNESPELAARAAERIRADLVGFVSALSPIKGRIRKD
ncbi:MAG TPA: cyclic nucleotide-binding domain-containing protein [Devosiaceae bacterium]|nr:cyclic nucleotide-binding domain-containing protein [Devosiaceae bacterium]